MKVKEFYKKVPTSPAIIREKDSLKTVVETVLEDLKTRNAYVVGEDDRLVGVILPSDLLSFVGRESSRGGYGLLGSSLARKASDFMKTPAPVSLEDDAETAMKKCVEKGLEELPVCKDGKVVGELTFFEILMALAGRGDE